jgi:hypothetical protein
MKTTTTPTRHLVGTFNEKQLVAKEDKAAIEKAKGETGLTYIDSKHDRKKRTMTVWLITSEEYLKSDKF